jgi:hypothetical protein
MCSRNGETRDFQLTSCAEGQRDDDRDDGAPDFPPSTASVFFFGLDAPPAYSS